MKLNNKLVANYSLLITLSMVLGIIDSFIPSYFPGMKLGLANIIILISLYSYNFKSTLFINLSRVFLASILRGTFLSMGFFMSLIGALLSMIIMYILIKYLKKLHIIGVSVIGSIFHSIGQILVGIIYFYNINLIYYLPILILSSIVTGIFIGLSAKYILKSKLFKNN